MNSFAAEGSQSVNKKEQKSELEGLDLAREDFQQLAISAGLELTAFERLVQERKAKKDLVEENTEKLGESQTRQWMVKHGKKNLINFDDKERYKLKQFFKSLDADGSGSIGIDELADPLISLGIAKTIEEVEKIIMSVDDDQSGQIEFKEFLKIIGTSQDEKGDTAIIDFFKDMISGRLAGGKISNKLPFDLIISTVRRKQLMNSMMSGDLKEKTEGEQVMNAYGKLVAAKKKETLQPTRQGSASSRGSSTKRKGSNNSENMSKTSIPSRSSFKNF